MASATTLTTTMPIQPKRTGKSQQEQHKEDIYKMRYKQQPAQDSSAWAYPQQQAYPADWSLYQQHYAAPANGSYYYVPSYYQYYPNVQQQQQFAYPQHPQRPSSRARTPPMSVQKSSSTPIPTSRPRNHQHRTSTMPKQPVQQQQRRRNHDDRKSPMPRNSTAPPPLVMNDPRPSRPSSSSSSTTSSVTGASSDFSSGRRSSVTSVSSNVSIRSEMSVSSKLSLSKRLRKVFSVSSLRSGKQGSVGSLNEANGSNTSLSTFDDSSSVVSSATTSTTASRSKSFRRRSMASLSNLFHKNNEVTTVPEEEEEGDGPSRIVPSRSNGLHTHGSPRLRPATSSSSVETEVTSCSKSSRRKIQFCPTIQVHETFGAAEYDRRCDMSATCQKMTPLMAMKIKQELNEYKLTDMQIHVDSRKHTHFFL